MHPQVLYFDRNDTLFVDCWQLSGPSKSGGPLPGWRAFELAKIRSVESLLASDAQKKRPPEKSSISTSNGGPVSGRRLTPGKATDRFPCQVLVPSGAAR